MNFERPVGPGQVQLRDRPGSDIDAEILRKTFKDASYEVDVHFNPTSQVGISHGK